jgi:hypothetical protein
MGQRAKKGMVAQATLGANTCLLPPFIPAQV